MRTRILVVPLLAGAAILTGPAVAANAATLACGSTITSSVTLTGDLHCAGAGLHVTSATATSITINLAGHQITGNGTGSGIDISPWSAKVTLTVTRGTIGRFATALVAGGPREGSPNILTMSAMTLQNNGQWLDDTFRGLSVSGSAFENTGNGGAGLEGSAGIDNSFFLHSGVGSFGESHSELSGDVFIGGGYTQGNLATLKADNNLFEACGIAINVPDADGGTSITNNTVMGCSEGAEIHGDSGAVPVTGNRFIGNKGAGLVVSAGTAGMTISGNSFLGNRGDGLTGAAAGTGTSAGKIAVSKNTAYNNAGHGINLAVATDGGGNIANNNRTLPNCVGVVCIG